MGNITVDSSGVSDQLGIYDFFNVLLNGTVFVMGLCSISRTLNAYVWSNVSFPKGLGIVLSIYIVGLILQELSSYVDKKWLNIYKGMNQRILNGKKGCKREQVIISNPILLKQYRKNADELLNEYFSNKDRTRFENEFFNGFIFSVCQYYVSVKGKDKKVEKMRALFSMSKTLMVSFGLLAVCAMLSLLLFAILVIWIQISGFAEFGDAKFEYMYILKNIVLVGAFISLSVIFYYRTKRVMKNFLLILLGTYNALLPTNEVEGHKRVKVSIKKKLKESKSSGYSFAIKRN